jgi:outer membrane protein insertion porin family
MRRRIALFLSGLFLVGMLSAEVVERVDVEGLRRVSAETVRFYMRTREGLEYEEGRLREDFRSLWATGFFEDIRLEVSEGGNGKVVKVALKENRLISAVEWKLSRKVKQSDIDEKLKEANVPFAALSYYTPAKSRKVERSVRDMLVAKGFNDAAVKVEEKPEGSDQVKLVVRVEAGSKTRIGLVEFPGLAGSGVLPEFLRLGMKNNRQHGFLAALGSKDVYNRDKIEEDLEEVRLRLQQKGYLEAKVGTPELSSITGPSIWGTSKRMLKMVVPVDLGPRYRVGQISFEGSKVIPGLFLKQFMKLKQGRVYNIKKRNKSVEQIQKFYGGLGYFYCQVAPEENLDPVKQVADLKVRVQENDVAYLGKLEFIGNTFTKDHVIRREWLLREGRRLNTNALEDSMRRMKQLGLVTMEKMPEIKPDPADPTKINITAEVKELNRQSINFNVGYSAYDGWFIGGGYSTQNFLGLGETFGLTLQTGTRSNNYQVSFTEPYLFNLPASLGIEVFKTRYNYVDLYTQSSEGFSLSTGMRLWRFLNGSFAFSSQWISISDVNEEYFPTGSYYSYYYQEGSRRVVSVSPTFSYSTVDSPIFPSSGVKYLASYRYSGGFLGGDVNVHKLKLEFVKFKPLWHHHTLGLHLEYDVAIPFGGKTVPFYERYYLGGERSIRGFDVYELGPRNENAAVLGGTKMAYANLEYAIPLSQQFSIIGFYDIGNVYATGKRVSFNDLYSSLGVEMKIYVPMLNVPFRLIFAYNPRVLEADDSHVAFRFAVGPSFY